MKKTLSLLLMMVMLLTVTALASNSRAVSVIPDIQFNGTEAECIALISGDKYTDSIYATMTLKDGNTEIDSWSGVDSGILNLVGTATVERNKTYTLTVIFSVNGHVYTPITISRTNN